MQERGLWRLLLHHRHLAPSASSVKALATSACGMVYICGAARTPLGSFQGGLSHLSAVELGGIAVHAAVRRSGADPTEVSEVLLGNVCSANLGQAPARQVALQAGLPLSTDCTSINKVCSSGMKAIMLGAQAIATGAHSVVVVGGFESMTNVPYYAPAARSGARLVSGWGGCQREIGLPASVGVASHSHSLSLHSPLCCRGSPSFSHSSSGPQHSAGRAAQRRAHRFSA